MACETRTCVTLLHVSENAHVNKHCRRRNTTEAEDRKPGGVAIVVMHARQRAVNKGQEDAACSVTKTTTKTAKKERHKNKKNDPRSRSRKKGKISGKKTPREVLVS